MTILPPDLIKSSTSLEANGTSKAAAPELSDERKAELIEQAKAILSGQMRAPEFEVPNSFLESVHRRFQGYDPPPNPEALYQYALRHAMEAHFRGEPIATTKTPSGRMSILASGQAEIIALLESLNDEERSRVVVRDTLTG